MIILRKIVAAATSILLVLLSTPAVVEGTCKCKEVCPKYNGKFSCWVMNEDPFVGGGCLMQESAPCDAYCSCNLFGCKCTGCESPSGDCGWGDDGKVCEKNGGTLVWWPSIQTAFWYNVKRQLMCIGARRMLEDEEDEDTCADFDSFTSLSADGKRNLLAEKYCDGEDQIVREDIYEILLSFALSNYEGVVLSEVELAGGMDTVLLTCDLFNKAYGDVSHLTLCEHTPQHHLDSGGVPVSNKKGKKQKKTL